MKKQSLRVAGICAAIIASLSLSGCGAYPNLTDEQYNQVVEYSAGLLLKYSNNGVKKLTYLEPSHPVEGVDALPEEMVSSSPILSGDTPESSAAASIPEVAQLPEGEEEAPEAPEVPEGEVLEGEEGAEGEAGEASANSVEVSQGDKQTLSNGMTVMYNGYAVYNYYPLEMTDVIISAELGNKLLVLDFALENPTDEPLTIDMVTEDPVFRLFINEVGFGRYRPTILEDDLSTVRRTLEPGERISTCLVVEVSEDTSREINSIRLHAKYDGKEQSATLN